MKWRKSALFKFEILGLIVNRLTADDKYSRRNIQNLKQELQTAISQKQKTFSGIFITYLKSITNSEAFAKKVQSASLSISEIIEAGKSGYLTSNRPCFRTSFGNQRVYEIQTLLKSTPSHYYFIFP